MPAWLYTTVQEKEGCLLAPVLVPDTIRIFKRKGIIIRRTFALDEVSM
jgi:hypothetical protein